MLSIVWFHDDRDHPKGIDGLRIEDIGQLASRLPEGAQLLSWRPTTRGDGAGAVLLRFTTPTVLHGFMREHRALECAFQTEFWVRDWNARTWFVNARRRLGPALMVR